MKTNIEVICAKRIRAGSLGALVFSGSAMIMIPLCVFFGVLAFFGSRTVHLNGNYVTGIGGLLLALVYGPLFTGIFGALAWPAAYLGIWVVGRYRPFRIEYVAADPQGPDQRPLAATITPSASAGDRAAGSRGSP